MEVPSRLLEMPVWNLEEKSGKELSTERTQFPKELLVLDKSTLWVQTLFSTLSGLSNQRPIILFLSSAPFLSSDNFLIFRLQKCNITNLFTLYLPSLYMESVRK